MHNIIKRFKKQDTIKVYLYANNQCIKVIKVPRGENIFENNYFITVLFKKHLFGSNIVRIMIKPNRMLKNIEGQIHATVDYERGVEL